MSYYNNPFRRGLNIKPSTYSFHTPYCPLPGTETSWIAGLSYERLISIITDRLAIRLDVLYFKQNFYSYTESTPMVARISRNDTYFSFSGIKAPLIFQYSLTGRRIIPFVNAGVAYQSILTKNYLHTEEVEDAYQVINTYQDNDLKFKSNELSVVCGAGVKTRLINNSMISIQGRFEYGSGIFVSTIADNKYLKQNSFQATFLVGFTF